MCTAFAVTMALADTIDGTRKLINPVATISRPPTPYRYRPTTTDRLEGRTVTTDATLQDAAIDRYRRRLQQRIGDGDNKIAESTYSRYLTDLRWLDTYLAETDQSATDTTPADAEDILLALAQKYNGPTGGDRWRTISRFFEYLCKRDQLDENPCDRWSPKDLGMSNKAKKRQYVRDASNETVYAPSSAEIDQMLAHVRSTQDRLRDQLIIKLLYHTGCRIDEFRHICLDDLDRDNREIRLRQETTKNNESRIVRYGRSVDGLLREWLDHGYRDRLKHQQSPYLIITQKSPQISKSALTDTVKIAAKNAGINEPLYEDAAGNPRWKITPHSLRHACATTMIENGADIYHVSKYLGHRSVKITERTYVHESDRLGVDEAHEFGPR